MKTAPWLLVVGLVTLPQALSLVGAGDRPTEIEGLIKQLGSPSFRVRTRAACRLKELGGRSVVHSLRQAAKSSQDPELAGRAKALVQDLCHVPARRTLRGHAASVERVAFSANGKLLASGSLDETVRLWDLDGGTCLARLAGHRNAIEVLAFLEGDRLLATCSHGGTMKLWDVSARKEVAAIRGPEGILTSVAVPNEGGLWACVGTHAAAVELWDMRGNRVGVLRTEPKRELYRVVFSPDGKTLAGSGEKCVILWDIGTRSQRMAWAWGNRESGGVFALAFSPDGKRLASSSGAEHESPEDVKLWDLASGRLRATLKGHRDSVNSLAFTPDGTILGSGSTDGTAKLWDVSTGEELCTLTGHESDVSDVRFSPDGRTLATASADKTVRLWDVSRLLDPKPAPDPK